MITYDEDVDVVMVAKPIANIKPTVEEWNLTAEASTLLRPAYVATKYLQKLRLTLDQSVTAIHTLYRMRKSAGISVFDIPSSSRVYRGVRDHSKL